MKRFLATALVLAGLNGPVLAQDNQTLADIRQELTVLYVEVQRLKRELSTTGGVASNLSGTGALERIDTIEAELQRLTDKTEELEFRIDRVVNDGTRRVGDLEFRLCELEPGCDISALGDTPSLGGDTGAAPAPSGQLPAQPQPETQLATQERADFDRAKEALDSGSFRAAADQFAAFNQTYPDGPLAIEAELHRGVALESLGDVREGARAYLAAFSRDPQSAQAAEALYRLGAALGRLGQQTEACLTLDEVAVRFPGDPAVAQAEAEKQDLVCP